MCFDSPCLFSALSDSPASRHPYRANSEDAALDALPGAFGPSMRLVRIAYLQIVVHLGHARHLSGDRLRQLPRRLARHGPDSVNLALNGSRGDQAVFSVGEAFRPWTTSISISLSVRARQRLSPGRAQPLRRTPPAEPGLPDGMNRSLMTLPFPVPHQPDELPARDQSS